MEIKRIINTDTLVFRGFMNETNDCSVRAFAAIEGLDYQTARAIFRRELGRKNGKGVKQNMLQNFLMSWGFENVNGMKSKTLNQALKELDPKATYYVVVTNHAFTIKNGVVYGNKNDASRLRKRVQIIFKK